MRTHPGLIPLAPALRRRFVRRTSALLTLAAVEVLTLLLIGLLISFWAVVALIVLWALPSAAARPIRATYLNAMIPSPQRATILSFDSLIDNAGGIVAQPALGRSADAWGYPASYLLSAAGSALALPFLLRARQLNAPADTAVTPADSAAQASK